MLRSQSAVREHLAKICDRIDIPRVRLHDLRHINASVMLYLNIPAKYAMERGGWSDIKTMDKIYQFTFKDFKQLVDGRINDFFTEMLEGA
jgi:integrase